MDDWGGVGDALTGGGGGIADAANPEWVSEDPGAGWEHAPSGGGGGGEGGGGLGSAWDNATSAVEFGAVSAYHSVAGAFDSLTGDDTGAVVHDSLATAYGTMSEGAAEQAGRDLGLDQVDVTAALGDAFSE